MSAGYENWSQERLVATRYRLTNQEKWARQSWLKERSAKNKARYRKIRSQLRAVAVALMLKKKGQSMSQTSILSRWRES